MEYHLGFITLSDKDTKKVNELLAKTMKHAHGLPSSIASDQVWIKEKQGGFGVWDAGQVGDTAIIRTGLRLLNLGEESLAWQALRCRSEDSIFLQEAKREGFSKQESKARTKHGKINGRILKVKGVRLSRISVQKGKSMAGYLR